jgi:Holliday junction DNA helicase RuvA
MIDIVTGRVVAEGDDWVVVMTSGGVGYRVAVTRTALQHLERNNATIFTYLVVREDDMSLYGFVDEEERELFQVLISVTGVGPRLGLTILSTLSREHLQNAVVREEPDVLTRVPGIGKKTAQKIVFELKDKLAASLAGQPIAAISSVDADVIAALTALGYSVVEAQSALQSIPNDAPQEVEERVRLALQYFAS